jgi:hypothetical protein
MAPRGKCSLMPTDRSAVDPHQPPVVEARQADVGQRTVVELNDNVEQLQLSQT